MHAVALPSTPPPKCFCSRAVTSSHSLGGGVPSVRGPAKAAAVRSPKRSSAGSTGASPSGTSTLRKGAGKCFPVKLKSRAGRSALELLSRSPSLTRKLKFQSPQACRLLVELAADQRLPFGSLASRLSPGAKARRQRQSTGPGPRAVRHAVVPASRKSPVGPRPSATTLVA